MAVVLTVGAETGVLEHGLLRLLDTERLETSIIHKGTATRWISILQRQSGPVRFRLVMKSLVGWQCHRKLFIVHCRPRGHFIDHSLASAQFRAELSWTDNNGQLLILPLERRNFQFLDSSISDSGTRAFRWENDSEYSFGFLLNSRGAYYDVLCII